MTTSTTDPARRAAQAPCAVRQPAVADGAAITAIHAEGLASGHASFRASAYGWAEWQTEYGRGCALVAEVDGAVAGWAGIVPTSDRCVYAGIGEVSVYVGDAWRGRGVGAALLDALIAASEAAGYWTLIAQIFPENTPSLALHDRAGFRTVGVRQRLGRMCYGPCADTWRDVILLERRSTRIGRD